jgi:hypothetical protein
MKVWNNSWYSNELKEHVIYSGELFVKKLTDYFEYRSYGDSVKEIFYIEVCENPIFSANPAKNVLYYDVVKKRIEIGLELDFKIASRLSNEDFLRYLANKYLERSLDIEELEITDFNLRQYTSDLEAFFKANSAL